ncbi:SPOR domain-containing protein [Thermophagus sp. OGC60D27]|uniref:SPOR domain-containing protein n=1 Tax=Thermophagus sp. OGC60D27 TaxID=3458415 RepID=UPI0040382560
MKGYLLSTLFCLMVVPWAMGQLPVEGTAPQSTPFEHLQKVEDGKGIITIEQSGRMQKLVMTRIAMNKRAAGVEGFRVQLFSGVGSKARQEAQEIKAKVLSQFPDENIFIEYSAPFWRVRAGSFRHKHEALPLMEKLKEEFPACYIVRTDDISLNDFE